MTSEPEDSSLNRARRMRREPTPAEEILGAKLHRNRFGVKYRRQHPIGNYIPDFYCYAARLAVELDGSQHGSAHAVEYDEARSDFLAAGGSRVLRFSNGEVMSDIGAVLACIYER